MYAIELFSTASITFEQVESNNEVAITLITGTPMLIAKMTANIHEV